MKPFKIRDRRELIWIKEWFRNQIVTGRSGTDLSAVTLAGTEEDVLRLIARLQPEERTRLQKSLSARRSRSDPTKKPTVAVELSKEARQMLSLVAEYRGLTYSEVIEQTLAPTCDEIYRKTGRV